MQDKDLVEIERLSHDGRGVARVSGKTVFVDGALPDEKVAIKYFRKKSKFDEAAVIKILESSQDRVVPRCEHHNFCGGCSLQHLNGISQIIFKQNVLVELIEHTAKIKLKNIMPPLQASLWSYRNRARLGVKYIFKKETVFVGFRERNAPRYLAEIAKCQILPNIIGDNIIMLRQLIESLDAKHSIAQIEVVVAKNAIALIFRNLITLNITDQEKLCNFARHFNIRIYLQPSNPNSTYLLYPDEAESLYYEIPDFNLKFEFSVHDFTQVHSEINVLMLTQAMDWLELNFDDDVIDWFCGLGNFSLALAKYCRSVIGFEASEAMVKQAAHNANINHIQNVSFKVANLFDKKCLTNIIPEQKNVWLLDPPRAGAIELIEYITTKTAPNKILYVSCNPATLARDADVLINKKNYQLIKIGVLDMFPHTTHVESMALFVKKGV